MLVLLLALKAVVLMWKHGHRSAVQIRLWLYCDAGYLQLHGDPEQEIATMRMRILKKHGTGIPDASLSRVDRGQWPALLRCLLRRCWNLPFVTG